MTGLAIFRVDNARNVTSLASFPESAIRPCHTLTEWHQALMPVLPAGARWTDSFHAHWRSSTNELELRIEPDLSSLAVEARDVAEGEVLRMLQRMQQAGTWVVVSLNRGEVFDYAHPDTN